MEKIGTGRQNKNIHRQFRRGDAEMSTPDLRFIDFVDINSASFQAGVFFGFGACFIIGTTIYLYQLEKQKKAQKR